MSATPETLQAAFRVAFDPLRKGDKPTALVQLLTDGALTLDEDVPFILDMAGFKDQLEFHFGGMWESRAWITREERFTVVGHTGVITALFTLRGKPRSAGFRLRHGNLSLTCAWMDGRWRALAFAMSALDGYITDGSPG